MKKVHIYSNEALLIQCSSLNFCTRSVQKLENVCTRNLNHVHIHCDIHYIIGKMVHTPGAQLLKSCMQCAGCTFKIKNTAKVYAIEHYGLKWIPCILKLILLF